MCQVAQALDMRVSPAGLRLEVVSLVIFWRASILTGDVLLGRVDLLYIFVTLRALGASLVIFNVAGCLD